MIYLSVAEIIELHDAAVQLFGGRSGIRDERVLESCAAQPKTAVFGIERFPTASEKAAAYCFFITRMHPFVDGNKRSGFLAGLHFLLNNGFAPVFDEEEMFQAITAVAKGEMDIVGLNSFFVKAVST